MASLADLLDPAYPGPLAERTLAEVRRLRAECQEVETGLSLLRRLVQGQLDIVGAEQARRRAGAAPGELPELIDRLPEVLADRTLAPGVGRLPQLLAPEAIDPALEAEWAALVGPGVVAGLPELADDDLGTLAERLAAFEQKVSSHRRALFDRIDALQAELTRRYRDGEASVDALLEGPPG